MEDRTYLDFLGDMSAGDIQSILDNIPWDDRETIILPNPTDDGQDHVLLLGRIGRTQVAWSQGFDERNTVWHSHERESEAVDCFRHKVGETRQRVLDIESGRGLDGPDLPPRIRQLLEMLQAAGGPGVDVDVIQVPAHAGPRQDHPMIGRPVPADDGQSRYGMYL